MRHQVKAMILLTFTLLVSVGHSQDFRPIQGPRYFGERPTVDRAQLPPDSNRRIPSLPAHIATKAVRTLEEENYRLRQLLQKMELDRFRAIRDTVPAEEANALSDSIWRNSTIEVTWENPSEQNKNERKWVRDAIKATWEKESGLEFTNWGKAENDTQGIRIRIEDAGPHCKRLGNKLNGLKDGMVLNFTFANWCNSCGGQNRKSSIEKIAVHEFGHAIGLAHEQNRTDAPEWCQNERQGTDGDWFVTVYDPESIMNYCNPEWNNGGKLSPLDIDAVRILYGEPN